MRIAMVAACPFPWPRGTPIRIHRMAEALGRRGHDVHVVTYHLGGGEPTPHMTLHRITGARGYTRTSPGPSVTKLALLDPKLMLLLRRLLREDAFDVIHAHHYESLLVALLARGRGGPPVVFDSHTLLESELPSYGHPMLARVSRTVGGMIENALPWRADGITAVSEAIRTRLEGNGRPGRARVNVIPNGVELEHFDTGRSFEAAKDVLVYAGNLARYQRIDLLLRAFAVVLRHKPHARLQIITDHAIGAYAQLLLELGIEAQVDIVAADYAALPERLGRASVLANPRTECSGLPQKLLNYMASGSAIVSFAGSGKLLQHGRTGLVVANGDVQAFASAVLRLMDDAALRAALGCEARETVAREHSWQRVAERVEAAYAQVLETSRR